MSHWYIRDGNIARRYEQKTKDGEPRNRIDRRRAIADGAGEGATSIINRCLDQEQLLMWSGSLGIQAASAAIELLGIAQIPEEQQGDFEQLAQSIWQQLRDDAATRGSELHDAIEEHLKSGTLSDDPIARTAQMEVAEWMRTQSLPTGRSEHCVFYEGPLPPANAICRYGGTVDWVCEQAILDFKTYDHDKGRSPIKIQHVCQLAAYRVAASAMGFCRPDAACWNLYIDRETGRLVSAKQWSEKQLSIALNLFGLACMVSTGTDLLKAALRDE